ncbi:unnamed protein product [Camellia sinensis]
MRDYGLLAWRLKTEVSPRCYICLGLTALGWSRFKVEDYSCNLSKKRKKEKGFPVPSLSPVLSSLLSSPSPPTRTHCRHSKALLANSTITSLFDTDHHKHSSFNFSDQLTRKSQKKEKSGTEL